METGSSFLSERRAARAEEMCDEERRDLAIAAQRAVFGMVASRVVRGYESVAAGGVAVADVVLSGGVAANGFLRET